MSKESRMRKTGRSKRIWNVASWVIFAGAALFALLAWTPSLRFAFGSPTAAEKRPSPNDFSLPTIDGKTWSLSSNRGKVVLVNFWATWCPPCRMETPDLVSLKSDYANRDFEIVGINMDDDQSKAAPFARQYGINYPVLLPNSTLALAQGVSALPTTILLDREGRVAREYVGIISERAVRADIDRLLAERRAH